MNKRNISMVAILLVMVSVGVFAATNSDLTGSDFVSLGQLDVVSGMLSEVDGEWYLTTTDKEYALHLGNYEVIYPQGIDLKEGSEALVKGFVLDSDISAVTVGTHDTSYTFRTAEGLPLWAGQGQRQNQQAFQNERTGLGNYRQSVVKIGKQATRQAKGCRECKQATRPQAKGCRECKQATRPQAKGCRECKQATRPQAKGCRECKQATRPQAKGCRECKQVPDPPRQASGWISLQALRTGSWAKASKRHQEQKLLLLRTS